MNHATIPTLEHAVKPPRLLTDAEMERLVSAFCEGKSAVLEDDVLTVARWAEKVKFEHLILNMILRGQLRPVLLAGEVGFEAAAGGKRKGEVNAASNG